jgi:AraC-like DNA-binding protein/quercetin dioxygenase-like cupin family protein
VNQWAIENFASNYAIFALKLENTQIKMKPRLLAVKNKQLETFNIRYEKAQVFQHPWHYHPELELNLIVESTGIRFVGDSIEPFEAGDLVLLGSNLPHYWMSDKSMHAPYSTVKAQAIILRFRIDLWGKLFTEIPEMKAIKALFERATRGLIFGEKIRMQIKPLLEQLLEAQYSARIRLWLHIFEILSETEDYRFLSQMGFINKQPLRDSDRINTVLTYVQEHLADPIALEDVAKIANMSIAAFCRYFKQQTNKTFIEALNELRISYACRLLAGTQKDISLICFESGFRNVPHFNAVFKENIHKTPSQYRLELGLKVK